MLKVLLIVYVSLAALVCQGQPTVPEWSGPSELEVEDPNRTVSDLSVTTTDKNRVLLSWKINGSTLPGFFAIERSDNGKPYEVVTVLNNLSPQKLFQWTDEAPRKGRNHYRLRYSLNNTDSLFSKVVMTMVDENASYKFYPNPVDHVLIIRSESLIDVQISDANGKIRISQPRIQGLFTINVSSLEKGVYLIRFSSKLTGVMSQEKLIKN